MTTEQNQTIFIAAPSSAMRLTKLQQHILQSMPVLFKAAFDRVMTEAQAQGWLREDIELNEAVEKNRGFDQNGKKALPTQAIIGLAYYHSLIEVLSLGGILDPIEAQKEANNILAKITKPGAVKLQKASSLDEARALHEANCPCCREEAASKVTH